MPLMSSRDYQLVRRNISYSLNETTVPDAVFQNTTFMEEAEDWVAARTSNTGPHAVRAARYYAAYLLVPMVWGQLQAAHHIVGGDETVGWKELAAELLRRAEREIAAITGETPPDPLSPRGTYVVKARPGY